MAAVRVDEDRGMLMHTAMIILHAGDTLLAYPFPRCSCQQEERREREGRGGITCLPLRTYPDIIHNFMHRRAQLCRPTVCQSESRQEGTLLIQHQRRRSDCATEGECHACCLR